MKIERKTKNKITKQNTQCAYCRAPKGQLAHSRVRFLFFSFFLFLFLCRTALAGTHYSSAATVLYYLIRMEPFTKYNLHLQGGSELTAHGSGSGLDAQLSGGQFSCVCDSYRLCVRAFFCFFFFIQQIRSRRSFVLRSWSHVDERQLAGRTQRRQGEQLEWARATFALDRISRARARRSLLAICSPSMC